MYYRKHQSKRLLDASIQILLGAPVQKFTGFHNRMQTNKCTFLYRNNFIFAEHCWVEEEKCMGAERNYQKKKLKFANPSPNSLLYK